MKNTKTLYHFVLDKSGSMSDVREQTINMFNEQLSTIKVLQEDYPEQEFFVGLTTFNDRIFHLIDQQNVAQAEAIDRVSYQPGGMTALHDAIGESIMNVNARFGHLIDNDEMSVVVVVLTDGGENSSRRFHGVQIAQMMAELDKTNKWSFTILGADFDITAISSSMRFNSSRNYSKSQFSGMSDDIDNSIRGYAESKSKGFIDKEFFKRKFK